jgi:hypothetical protein
MWAFDRFCHGDSLRDRHTAVGMFLALHGEFDGENVLALQAPRFVIRTGAMWGFRIRADAIAAMARL